MPALIFLSILYPDNTKEACHEDLLVPYCQQQNVTFIGNESYRGALVNLSMNEDDICYNKKVVRYFLMDDGTELESTTFLPFGTYWVQSFVTRKNGEITSCTFALEITHPKIQWPVEDSPTRLLSAIGEIPLVDLPEEELDVKLGTLSIIWESGEHGPGVISGGNGDPGGPSYGLYQISLKKGYLQDFLNFEGQAFRSVLNKYPIGSPPFNKVWKSIAESHPILFHKAQHEYIRRSHYQRAAMRVKRQLGLDIEQYGDALKDVLWSTSVQHGPYNDVFYNALRDIPWPSMSEAQIIRTVYRERRKIQNDKLAYFPRVNDRWKKNLSRRFRIEERMALAQLGESLEIESLYKLESMPPATDSSLEYLALGDHLNKSISATDFKLPNQNETASSDKSKPVKRKKVKPTPPDVPASSKIPAIPDNDDKVIARPAVALQEKTTDQPPRINPEKTNKSKSAQTYRVLFVVLSDPNAEFPKLEGLGSITKDAFRKGQYRYLIGNTANLSSAEKLLLMVKQSGFKSAIIARYKGDKLAGFVE